MLRNLELAVIITFKTWCDGLTTSFLVFDQYFKNLKNFQTT